MQKHSKMKSNPDLIQACRRLADTAETFVNRAPRLKRLESERSALFDALSHAQLVLCLTRLPQGTGKGQPKREKLERVTRGLEDQLKQSRAELASSRYVLEKLDWLMQLVSFSLSELQEKANKAQTLVRTSLKSPALPFRKSK